MIEDTSGFYKLDMGTLEILSALNEVCSSTYVLKKELKDTYIYPVDGWYWFDTKEEAEEFLIPTTKVVQDTFNTLQKNYSVEDIVYNVNRLLSCNAGEVVDIVKNMLGD